jgi:hypothetical protein
MKMAQVYRDKTGYWIAVDEHGRQIGRLQDFELDAIKMANAYGYLVR